jgi:hypothetical protein
MQVVSAIDEQNKIANLAYERISEWYGLHFPEFRHREPFKYVQVAAFFDRKNMDEGKLREILGEAAQNVLERAKTSVGVEFSDEDLSILQGQAKLVLEMHEMKERLEKYQDEICTRMAPNMSNLAGSAVAAKLIAASGGIQKLAVMPSSTIQVLGAEKALFKHLRSGSPSPKHGIIFQHPLISTAPRRARGKIARALAAKLAIAAKADGFTHNDISAKLKEQFEKRAQQILLKAKDEKDEPAPRGGEGRERREYGRPDEGANARREFKRSDESREFKRADNSGFSSERAQFSRSEGGRSERREFSPRNNEGGQGRFSSGGERNFGREERSGSNFGQNRGEFRREGSSGSNYGKPREENRGGYGSGRGRDSNQWQGRREEGRGRQEGENRWGNRGNDSRHSGGGQRDGWRASRPNEGQRNYGNDRGERGERQRGPANYGGERNSERGAGNFGGRENSSFDRDKHKRHSRQFRR